MQDNGIDSASKPEMSIEATSPKKMTYREMYGEFRKSGLGIIDSAYNALYIGLSNEAEEKQMPLKREYRHVAQHPGGWYTDKRKYTRNSVYDIALSLLEGAAHLFRPALRKSESAKAEESKTKGGILKTVKNIFPYAAPVVCGAAAFFIIGSYFPMNIDIVVNVNGEKIGFIESKGDIDAVVSEIEAEASEILGYAFKLPADITYTISERDAKNESYVSLGSLKKTLDEYTSEFISEGCGLYLDGVLVAVNRDKAVLENALTEAIEIGKELNPGALQVEFDNEITYATDLYPVSMFATNGEAVSILTKGIYSVFSYDELKAEEIKNTIISTSYGDIVKKEENVSAYYTSDKDLADITKEETEDEFEASFKVVREVEYTENIPFTTVYKKDPTMYVGKSYVAIKGSEGTMRVVAEATYVDGVETERVITGKFVEVDKVDTIVMEGSKLYPENDPSKGKKQYYSPIGDRILYLNSDFGYRKIFYTSGWNYHKGLDIETDYFTEVYAAMSGVVERVSVGSGSSYGNYIDIRHENGMLTRYAHLGHNGYNVKKHTGVLVKQGDYVKQGDLIAYAGDTGNVSGTHLHFEIRDKNNNPVDPKLYLDVDKYKRRY